jgi:hypothetical protein
MPTFGWQDIDHRLVVLKLIELGEELRTKTKADESRIRFENRLNMNSNTVPSLLLRMRVERSDERARREYEIYRAVWQTQGYVKSAAFVRGVGAHIVRMLGRRANSIANWFSRFVRQTNLPFSLRTAHLKSLDLRMQQLQGRWHRRIEIEAKECEHAERRERDNARAVLRRLPVPPNERVTPILPSAREPVSQPSLPEQKGSNTEPQAVTASDMITKSSTAGTATWEEINISFLSDERIQIRNGPVLETRNYCSPSYET